MAAAANPFTKDVTNGARFSAALINAGTVALRTEFDEQVTKSRFNNLQTALNDAAINALIRDYQYGRNRKPRILTSPQYKHLYPGGIAAQQSNCFDITLLSFLLLNILPEIIGAGVPIQPLLHTGPNAQTIQDIKELRTLRNQAYGHIVFTGVSNKNFNQNWIKLSNILSRFGIPPAEIDSWKDQSLSPELEQQLVRCENEIKAQCDNDITFRVDLLKIINDVCLKSQDEVVGSIKELQTKVASETKSPVKQISDLLSELPAEVSRRVYEPFISGQEKLLEGQDSIKQMIEETKKENERQTNKLIEKVDQTKNENERRHNELIEKVHQLTSSLNKTDQTEDVTQVEEIQQNPGFLKDVAESLNPISQSLKTQYLRRYSKVQHIPWKDDSWLPMDEIFIPLELQEHKDNQKWTRKTQVYRDYDSMLTEFQQKNLPMRIVIKADPGCGKSTQSEKIAYDWAQGKGSVAKYDLVVLLKAREFVTEQSIIDSIMSEFPKDQITISHKQNIESMLHSDKFKTLIIIDGYDELLEKRHNQSDIHELVDNKLYTNSDLIITTRPWCVDELKARTIDSVLSLSSFDEAKILLYIKAYFITQGTGESNALSQANDLLKQIQKQQLMSLAEVPLTCLFLCLVWEVNEQKLPKYKTDLYLQLFDALKETHSNKTKSFLNESKWKSLLMSSGKLAFDKLVTSSGILIFTTEDLFEHEVDIEFACAVGLLTKTQSSSLTQSSNDRKTVSPLNRYSPVKYYSFIHFTVQEFLASFFLYHSESFTDNFEKLKTIKKLVKLQNLFTFFSGLFKGDPDGDSKVSAVSGVLGLLQVNYTDMNQFAQTVTMPPMLENRLFERIHICWKESGYDPKIKWHFLSPALIVKNYKMHSTLNTPHAMNLDKVQCIMIDANQVTENEYANVGTFFDVPTYTECNSSLCLTKVFEKLKYCKNLKIIALKNFDCTCKNKLTGLSHFVPQFLYMSKCNLDLSDVSQLVKLDLSKLNFLDLPGNTEIDIGDILEHISPCSPTLISCQNDCVLSEKHTIKAFTNLSKLKSLDKVEISEKNMINRSEMLKHIPSSVTDVLMPGIILRNKQLTIKKLSSTSAREIGPHISKFKSVEHLEISNNRHVGDGAQYILEHITPAVEIVDMMNCGIKHKHARRIAPHLRRLDKLQWLRLNANTELSYGAYYILENVSASLQKMILTNCGITSEHSIKMARHFSKMENLQFLDLSCNQLGDSVHCILDHLSTSLKYLGLGRCYITSEHAVKIALLLSKFTILEELYLCNNPELGSGAELLLGYIPHSVKYVNMHDCGLRNTFADVLMKQIPRLTNLQSVLVTENQITHDKENELRGKLKKHNIHLIS